MQKTLILFREGLSGHYLKSLIDDEPVEVKYRMDSWHPDIRLETIMPPVQEQKCTCLHKLPVPDFEKDFDTVFTIVAKQKIYQAMYNVFTKKILLEQFSPAEFAAWHTDLIRWYDRCYYNITEYWQLFQSYQVIGNVVEFDRILDVDYIADLFQKYYGSSLTDNQRRIVTEYAAKQLDVKLTLDGKTMQDIVAPIPDHKFQESPWFAAYCLFKYEKNNGLAEERRLWTIDSVTQPIDKQFLLTVARQYR